VNLQFLPILRIIQLQILFTKNIDDLLLKMKLIIYVCIPTPTKTVYPLP